MGRLVTALGIYNLINKGTDQFNDFRARAVLHYLIDWHSRQLTFS
ncbi:hypothetical protein [Bacillus sp. LL01]|nr:hypothetical protein [Bacillus sp. LL01]